MKTYKINNVEINEEQINEIIKNNPELLKSERKSKYFMPKKGQLYWIIVYRNNVYSVINNSIEDDDNIEYGSAYRTKEDAQKELEKRKALKKLWDYADTNMPFDPDWGNDDEKKYLPVYDYDVNRWAFEYSYFTKKQFILPYFKSYEDCHKFIKDNLSDLEIIRN